MIQRQLLLVLGGLSAGLVGCGSSSTDTAGAESGVPGGGTSGDGSIPTGPNATPAMPGAPGGALDGSVCVPGVPATSQFPRLLNRQYDAVVRDLLGVTAVAAAGDQPPSAILYADFDGPMNVDAWRIYQDVAAVIAAEVMAGPNRSRFIACDPAVAGCLTETIRTFGRRAFRRLLTEAEVTRFERLGQTSPPGTPEEVAQTTLEAFLVSPSFLQIVEQSQTPDPSGAGLQLSSHEVAARLSFLLWGSVPDDTLDAAADAGQLTSRDQILAQARRMIAIRDKTGPLVAGLHRAYLDMDNADAHWFKIDHDTTRYPLYPADGRAIFAAELDRYFEEVAFGGGSFSDLFLSNVAYVNAASAPIYGLDPAAYGSELTRVELDPVERPGFLTRLGFLSSYSHFDATSPILRGAFITINIIGVNPGTPDPSVFLTPVPPGTYYTERQAVEALTGQPPCSTCHTPFVNPPGFVLEGFDSIGGRQTIDPRSGGDPTTGTIDTTADVTLERGSVTTISSPLELMQAIAALPGARHLYAERFVSFTTGRLPNPSDACLVDLLEGNLAQDGYPVLDLLADLTQADSFRLRVRETP